MLRRISSNCWSQSAAKESEMTKGLAQVRVILLGSAEKRTYPIILYIESSTIMLAIVPITPNIFSVSISCSIEIPSNSPSYA